MNSWCMHYFEVIQRNNISYQACKQLCYKPAKKKWRVIASSPSLVCICISSPLKSTDEVDPVALAVGGVAVGVMIDMLFTSISI